MSILIDLCQDGDIEKHRISPIVVLMEKTRLPHCQTLGNEVLIMNDGGVRHAI